MLLVQIHWESLEGFKGKDNLVWFLVIFVEKEFDYVVFKTTGRSSGLLIPNRRRIKQANRHVLTAALCYNLKKLMKFSRPKLKFNYKELEIDLKKAQKSLLFLLFGYTVAYRFSEN
jgi:hypothetical protein